MTENRYERLVVVSNRLPVVLHRQEDSWQIKGGSGGLVSALGPVLRDRGGVWIGWPGTSETIGIREVRNILGPASESSGYRLFPVFL
ncbi:MAG TPA: trehalose-6-phosphate synthase, partial [Synergistaceae bacterium]|nr:trehalose-6-phosphate synthase [Synergistaceae bacterium]